MDQDQWMSKEVNMDYENKKEYSVNEPYVDCSKAFNTSQVIMLMIVSDLIK